MNFTAFGGRRFALCLLVFCVTTVLLWFGKLSDGGYTTITLATVGSLIAGHTYENVKTSQPPKDTP